MELIIGRIENCKSSKILVIHNKKLTEKAKEFEQKITLKKHLNGIEIIPKGETHVTIGQNKRFRITITQLIKDKTLPIHNKNQIKIFIDLEKWGINKKELFNKGKGNPLTKIIPKDLIRKKATIKKGLRTYYIDISSKRLYEISKEEKITCLFNRLKEEIIIINSNNKEARRLTPHSKKRVQIAIPKEILTKKEIKKLSSKSWLPINIQINLESFQLKISDFYGNKEEKELVEYLVNEGIKIKIKEPSDPYDILLKDKGYGIEIHNSFPYKKDLATRHRVKPALVRLRILEAIFLIKNKKLNKFFVIINKKWEKGKYIQELINKEDNQVKILFTNFEDKWEEKIGEKILKNI